MVGVLGQDDLDGHLALDQRLDGAVDSPKAAGADAVAGVVNTVMREDFEGFTIRGRYTSYDNIPRDNASVTIECGDLFNGGATRVGFFMNIYNRDRVNSQDDPKWADSDYRRYIPEDFPWFGDTAFRNDSANSNWGQFDIVKSMSGDPYGMVARRIVDSAGRVVRQISGAEFNHRAIDLDHYYAFHRGVPTDLPEHSPVATATQSANVMTEVGMPLRPDLM